MSVESKRIPTLSIRYAIPGLVVGLIVVTVGIIAYLAVRSGQKAVNQLAGQLSTEVASRIDEHIEAYLEKSPLFHAINVAAVGSGALELTPAEMKDYIWNQVQIDPDVNYIYFANPLGEFVGVDLLYTGVGNETDTPLPVYKIQLDAEAVLAAEPGSQRNVDLTQQPTLEVPLWQTWVLDEQGEQVEIIRNVENYSPPGRPWYQDTVAAEGATWSSIYSYGDPKQLAIASTAPVFNENDELLGVFSVDLTLAEISDFLRGLEISKSGEAFIMERSGEIVAMSADEAPYVNTDEGQVRLVAVDSSQPLISGASQSIQERFGGLGQIEGSQSFEFRIDNKRQFAHIVNFQDELGLDWLIVVVVPASDFVGLIQDNVRSTALTGVAVVLIAAVLGTITARGIIRPLFAITNAASAIEDEQYELAELESVAGRSDELGQLALVFRRMAHEVYKREQELKRQVQELKIQIDTTKQEEQVSEIVETDFFQDLQSKSAELRKKSAKRRRARDT